MNSDNSLSKYLQSLIQDSKTPGVQYLVVSADRTLFEYVGGCADLASRTPMTLNTTMMAYSMSKTITAAALLKLVESEKVKLEDTLDQYLDNQPYGPKITIRQLISHTSGIPNPIPLSWVHTPGQHDSFNQDAALAKVLRDNPRLSFAPGTRYKYSNIGYWLLGKIVERASGVSFASYVDKNVLQALGITQGELGYTIMDSSAHATGYLEKYSFINLVKRFFVDRELIGGYSGRWLQIYSHYLNGPAFGGLVGTVRGFGRILQDQLSPNSRLFKEQTRELFFQQQRTNSGVAIPMTLGWHVGESQGETYFYKEGGGGGFHCMMRLYPNRGIGTVVMTNATNFDVRALLDETDAKFPS